MDPKDTFTLDQLNRVVELQREFEDLYRKCGLIAVDATSVHIRSGAMESLAPLSDWNLDIATNEPTYPYEHKWYYKGVEFFALTVDPLTPPE